MPLTFKRIDENSISFSAPYTSEQRMIFECQEDSDIQMIIVDLNIPKYLMQNAFSIVFKKVETMTECRDFIFSLFPTPINGVFVSLSRNSNEVGAPPTTFNGFLIQWEMNNLEAERREIIFKELQKKYDIEQDSLESIQQVFIGLPPELLKARDVIKQQLFEALQKSKPYNLCRPQLFGH